MGIEGASARPTARRYSPQDKPRAVRLVPQLRKELGTTHGTIGRVAHQIGCGVESLRTWVKKSDIDEGYGAWSDLGGGESDQGSACELSRA